jgi:hypothetical protein
VTGSLALSAVCQGLELYSIRALVSGDFTVDVSHVLRRVCCCACRLLQGKRSAPPMTPQPQQQAAKKQKGAEGRPVSASAPAKGPVAKTAAAGAGPASSLLGFLLPVLWKVCAQVAQAAGTAPAVEADCCACRVALPCVPCYLSCVCASCCCLSTGGDAAASAYVSALVSELKKSAGSSLPLSTLASKVCRADACVLTVGQSDCIALQQTAQ